MPDSNSDGYSYSCCYTDTLRTTASNSHPNSGNTNTYSMPALYYIRHGRPVHNGRPFWRRTRGCDNYPDWWSNDDYDNGCFRLLLG